MPKQLKGQGRVTATPPDKPKPAKKAAKKASKKKSAAKADKSTSKWIRNIHNGAGGIRLDLDDRRVFLAPRGQLGDLMQVSEDMQEDPLYQRNVNLLFEELTKEQAADILQKQNTNAQAYRGPTPMDFITNELGQKYAQTRATITPSAESQGVTVGQVSTAASGQSARDTGNIARPSGAPPQVVQVPGSTQITPEDFDPNVMPGGLTTQQAGLYLETPPDQRYALLVRFSEEGAHAAGLQVTIEPTEES